MAHHNTKIIFYFSHSFTFTFCWRIMDEKIDLPQASLILCIDEIYVDLLADAFCEGLKAFLSEKKLVTIEQNNVTRLHNLINTKKY